jgi:alkaline phosphatase D
MQRRDLHRLALAWALSAWAQAAPAQAQTQGRRGSGPAWQANPFALGVASGQPRADSVVLWTRLVFAEADLPWQAQTQTVLCEVFADEALRQPVRQWQQETDARRAHSVHVLATGLQPGRSYWYRFVCGSASSPVGRTRTAPAWDAPVQQLRVAQASCQHFEQGHYVAHRDMAQRDLDFVLFLGDYIYESTNPRYRIRAHQGGVPKTLDEYRQRHAQYKSDADLRACHAAHPWVMTWDDHEVVNDYANDLDNLYSDPAVFLRRRAAAYQAYFEHMPVRLGPDPAAPHHMRIHDRMVWGQLAELWTLDCRQYRDHQACPDPNRGGARVVVGCDALQDERRSMLGSAQEAWLMQGLGESARRWKVIAQSTQMSASGVPTPLGRSSFNDAWDGYPLARERLLSGLAQARMQDVLVLGGDVHMNVAANLRVRPNDERSPVVASEIVTTSVTSRGMGETLLASIREHNPDIRHARADERGYTLLDIRPGGVSASFRTTPFPAQPEGVLREQARFEVLAGQAGVQRA